MKKLFILLALTVAGCITSALGQDVLYLKNGSIIKGELVKALPNEKNTISAIRRHYTFI
mgnify:CR=1 FL=1